MEKLGGGGSFLGSALANDAQTGSAKATVWVSNLKAHAHLACDPKDPNEGDPRDYQSGDPPDAYEPFWGCGTAGADMTVLTWVVDDDTGDIVTSGVIMPEPQSFESWCAFGFCSSTGEDVYVDAPNVAAVMDFQAQPGHTYKYVIYSNAMTLEPEGDREWTYSDYVQYTLGVVDTCWHDCS